MCILLRKYEMLSQHVLMLRYPIAFGSISHMRTESAARAVVRKAESCLGSSRVDRTSHWCCIGFHFTFLAKLDRDASFLFL
jgi:hypothetical protein